MRTWQIQMPGLYMKQEKGEKGLMWVSFNTFFFLILTQGGYVLLIFRGGGVGGKRERQCCERETSAASCVHHDLTEDWTRNSGVCPDQEWNVQPFGPRDDAPITWPTWPGLLNTILTTRNCPHPRRVFQKYTKYSQHDIKFWNWRCKVMCGELLYNYCEVFFAEKLHQVRKDVGTHHKALIRIIVSHSEIDMNGIKASYQKFSGLSLPSHPGGSWRRVQRDPCGSSLRTVNIPLMISSFLSKRFFKSYFSFPTVDLSRKVSEAGLV